MSLYHTLPIFADTYKLTMVVHHCVKNFDREFKFTLGNDMKNNVMQMLKMIYYANKTQDKERVQHLEIFQDCLEMLKLQVRIARDLNAISIKKQAEFATLLEKISKQANGWKKFKK